MKVISLLAFYMLMSQGSGASLNGLNQMDKKHEAEEELEDQLHLEKRKVENSSDRKMNVEMTTTMDVTTEADSLMTTELNEQNILEKLGVKGFVHLLSSVFEHHPEVLNEFLARKSNLLEKFSSTAGSPRHHVRPHLLETEDSASYLPVHYKKSNSINHRLPLRRHYNTAEKRYQNHIYHGSVFRSLEKGVAGHRQQDTFGQALKQQQQSEQLALPEKRSDVRNRPVEESKSSSSNSSTNDHTNSDDKIARHFMNDKNKQDKVNINKTVVVTHVETTMEEAQNNHGNVEDSTTLQPIGNRLPTADLKKNSPISRDDSTGDNAKFQYETDLQRTSFGEKKFSNGVPILPITEEKPMEIAQRSEVSRTQIHKQTSSVKHELQDDDQLTDKQLDSERNSSAKMIKVHKPTGASLQNTEDRDWVGVGYARQVATSASKTTAPGKLSKEIQSSVVDQNVKESHKNDKEVGLPLQVPIYSHRRLVPRRINRTKDIRSSENNVSLQSVVKNTDDMDSRTHQIHQQMFKERQLKPVLNTTKTKMAEKTTHVVIKDQDSNNDEEALMSLVSHFNTNNKQHKQ